MYLNNPFTMEEVTGSIKSFANNKAPGIDGIVIEMIKPSEDVLMPLLVPLFN